MEAETRAAAGWYPDPEQPRGHKRYWDGENWTEHRKKGRYIRKMTLALIAWTVGMGIWIISAANVASDCANKYSGQPYAEASTTGCQAGSGIAIFGLIVLWFLGFVVLSLIWFMTRPKES